MSLVTDRNDPALAEGQRNSVGQHLVYLVLSDDELAKGFVRPYRDKYVHTGQQVCGNILEENADDTTKICVMLPSHDGECIVSRVVTQAEYAKVTNTGWLGGCFTETVMGRKLSETYARQPDFYGATFCVKCNKHLPVEEFQWSPDGSVVGS